MALGFTSHYSKQDQPFGSLLISNTESETAGSVAHTESIPGLIFSVSNYDCCDFSVSVNIDYSQYAGFVAASGSTETAGSVATIGGCGVPTAASFTSACSVSSGGCSPASYTC